MEMEKRWLLLKKARESPAASLLKIYSQSFDHFSPQMNWGLIRTLVVTLFQTNHTLDEGEGLGFTAGLEMQPYWQQAVH